MDTFHQERRNLSHLTQNYKLTPTHRDLNVRFIVSGIVKPTQRLYELSIVVEHLPTTEQEEETWEIARELFRQQGKIDLVPGINPTTKCYGWTRDNGSLESPLLYEGSEKLKTETFYLCPQDGANGLSYLDFTFSIQRHGRTEARISSVSLPPFTVHPK